MHNNFPIWSCHHYFKLPNNSVPSSWWSSPSFMPLTSPPWWLLFTRRAWSCRRCSSAACLAFVFRDLEDLKKYHKTYCAVAWPSVFIIKKPLHVQVIYWTFSFSPIWCHRWWIIFFFSGFYILPHIELIFQTIINIICWTWWSSPAVVNYSPFCWHCLWIQRKWKGFKHPAYKNQVICSLLNYTQSTILWKGNISVLLYCLMPSDLFPHKVSPLTQTLRSR